MRQKTKAMLLSGLVLPGLGQIYLGRKKLGAGIAFIILSSIFWLFIRIFFLTWRTVMVKGSRGFFPSFIIRLGRKTGGWF